MRRAIRLRHGSDLRHLRRVKRAGGAGQDEDEGLALEACEFWAAFCDSAVDAQLLRPHLARVAPMLLKNMVYDEFDGEVPPPPPLLLARHPSLARTRLISCNGQATWNS